MLRISSLSGIRPIIRRAIRIAPQPSLLSQFYLHSDSADLLPQITSSSFRSAPLKNTSHFFAVGHSPYHSPRNTNCSAAFAALAILPTFGFR